LPRGSVKALKFIRRRVPKDADPAELEAIATVERQVSRVLLEEVEPQMAAMVLKACNVIREEVNGPLAQKHEHSGPDGGPLKVSIEINLAGGKK